MAYYTRDEETLAAAPLAKLQRAKLAAMWDEVLASNSFYQNKFADLKFDPSCDPLETLPFTTRGELQDDQAKNPPYGSNLTYPLTAYTRMHQTSGSTGTALCWLDTPQSWAWWKRCWGVIFRAAGVTDEDTLLFPFSFGPFIGFWGAFDASVELGNLSLPCGGMTTIARLEQIRSHNATVICCTPTYALHMAEVAESQGLDLQGSSVRALIVAGEPGGSIPSIRASIERRWGARVFDHVGMTEIGPWGFETLEGPGGVHVMENEFIAEVIDPATDQLVADGETGELVLTNLGRVGSPLIRYRTGDQVALTRGRWACGRSFARIEGGVAGRIDDMLFIRGNNVFPSAIEGILREFSEVDEFRIEVENAGAMNDLKLVLEVSAGADRADVVNDVIAGIQHRLHFRPIVEAVAPGTLPRFELKAKRLVRRP